MNLKKLNKERVIISVLILTLVIIDILFLVRRNISFSASDFSKPSPANIDSIVKQVKSENEELELVYESKDITDIISLVYKENDRYKNIIVDTRTGEKITFPDLIKEDKQEKYAKKELELLNLKYPEFIVKDIEANKGNTGFKIYYVKENEVIIYYYDYLYSYDYKGNVTLAINYNEIKDYLNFSPKLDESYDNEDGFNYDSTKKSIAITFDDGPSSKYNPLILEVLAKNKAHATFFMVGTMMNSCQNCVLETYKSGNEVGSHTYEHMNIKTTSNKKVKDSINKVDKLYQEVTGAKIKYLRPPYGSYSKENLENIDAPFILWDLDTEDWRYRDVNHIVDYITKNAKDGSIILMHELYETSYESLKIALPKLYSMGYQVVSIGDLAKLKGITLKSGESYYSLN